MRKKLSAGPDQQEDSQGIYLWRFQQEHNDIFKKLRKTADLLQNSASAWGMMEGQHGVVEMYCFKMQCLRWKILHVLFFPFLSQLVFWEFYTRSVSISKIF